MKENISESFNRLQQHDSKLRALRVLRHGELDEVILDVELRGASAQELTPMAVVLEDAIFLFSDLDLQGRRECAFSFLSNFLLILMPRKYLVSEKKQKRIIYRDILLGEVQ